MFYRATKVKFGKGTELEVTFADGCVKRYDMKNMFDIYPPLKDLSDRKLFESGKLYTYSIEWNDELDIGTDTIYEEGKTIRRVKPAPNVEIGEEVSYERACRDMSQAEMAKLSGIDQSDISKIERGVANPSVGTLKKIAKALGKELKITFVDIEES